jgi:ribokinase
MNRRLERRSKNLIVVIGSINMDLLCRTRAIPAPGETVLGRQFLTLPGGKGANQAVAAARLSSAEHAVHMIGRVGDDDFGVRLLGGLKDNGVGIEHVRVTAGAASGIAMILVDRKGENSIVVAPGANHLLTPADLDAAEGLIASAGVVVMQLEIPLATVRHAIGMCQRLGVYTILDPAPAPAPPAKLPRALYGVDVFTPNESEARLLLGIDRTATRAGESSGGSSRRRGRGRGRKQFDVKQRGGALLARGAKSVVLKLGSRGSIRIDRDSGFQTAPAPKVKVVDTTAAGDAFTAALAVARAERMEAREVLSFANAAGAACCQTFGAQPALPTRSRVMQLMTSQG